MNPRLKEAEYALMRLIDMHQSLLDADPTGNPEYHHQAINTLTDMSYNLHKLYHPEDLEGSDWADKAREKGLQY